MTLSSLLTKLEAAEGASSELDAEIALAFGAQHTPTVGDRFNAQIVVPAWWTMPWSTRKKWPHRATPWPFTSSLDAIVALVEEKLPGWGWRIEVPSLHSPRPAFAVLWAPTRHLKVAPTEGATPALALCIALCRALHQPDQPEDKA